MKAYEIAFELRSQGVSQADVAAQLGLHHASVNNVVHGRATSFRVATYVANLINRNVHEIWPGRYEFEPRKRNHRKNSTRARAPQAGKR